MNRPRIDELPIDLDAANAALSSWYCRMDGRRCGPFSLEELKYLRDRGQIAADTDVSSSVSSPWAAASSIEGLFDSPAESSVATPTPSGTAVVSMSRPDAFRSAEMHAAPSSADRARRSQPAALSALPAPQGSIPPARTPPAGPHPPEDVRKKVAVGVGIGVAVALLVLLLLLFLRDNSTGGGGGRGQMAGGGSGDAPGDSVGAGLDPGAPSADPTEHAGSEVVAEELTPETAGAGQGSSSRPSATRPQDDPRPPTSFTIAQLPSETPTASSSSPVSSGSARSSGGSGLSELNRRLAREGAGGGEVQVSLMWFNINDLDLHIVCPSGERIFFSHKASACGGELDVDMNAGGQTSETPVENAFWPAGKAPDGKFVVYVHHYANQGARDPSRFEVVVRRQGQVTKYSGSLSGGDPIRKICDFTH